ncbi:Vmc-like lipoprotein signal peptide domain-containing protein [Mycoplasma mycoides]|uniref:Vmc-like lipoprotein signal peptide domain-containing protein n=1 Tax=Mycoplasma mycoides TaxID=2102 RepID=UPI00223FE1D9|nr:lipoprotein [Mycoplasma mycoides]QVK04829.1 lipoprotein [Mycoplasma mycoides subsp. capri]
MKKLITILGSICLSAGTIATAVACSTKNEKFDKPSITQELAQKIISGLKLSDDFNFTTGEKFSKLDYKTLVLNMINETISKNKYADNLNNLSKKFGLEISNFKDQGNKKAEDVLKNLATIKLFADYTSKRAIEEYSDSVDLSYSENYPLNPYNLISEKNKKDKTIYAIYYKDNSSSGSSSNGGGSNGGSKWLRWQTTGEFDTIDTTVPSTPQLPSVNLLTEANAKNFRIAKLTQPNDKDYIIKTASVDDSGNGNNNGNGKKIEWYKNPSNTNFETDGQGIMQYRFMYHFKTKIEAKLFDDLLGHAYVDSNLFTEKHDSSSVSNKKIILNNVSKLISDIQSNYSQVDRTVSNIKMVWAFSFDKQKISEVNSQISQYVRSDGSLINKDNKKTLKNVFDEIKKKSITNESKQGTDSLLSISGFNGFVKNKDTSIESLSGDLKITDEAKKAVARVNEPSLLTNNNAGFTSENSNNVDYVFVLPIYLNDLFSSNDMQFQKQNSSGGTGSNGEKYELKVMQNTWTNLNDKYFLDKQYFSNFSIKKVDSKSNGNVLVANKNNMWYVSLKNGTENAEIEITYSNNSKKTISLKKMDESSKKSLDFTYKLSNSDFNQKLFDKNLKNFSITYDINLKNYDNIKDKQNDAYIWNNDPKKSNDIQDLSAAKKQVLLDQLEAITAKNPDVQNAAKTELYSAYLYTDGIYYKSLFDEISKYIESEKPTLD